MIIEVHYMKHHPLYEFRDFNEFHVDPYRHWLHARVDYWNTERYVNNNVFGSILNDYLL